MQEANKEEKTESPVEDPTQGSKGMKYFYIGMGIIILVFASIFIIRFFNLSPEVVTIDDLHKKNIEGETTDINYMYDGFSFVFVDGLWYTQVQKGNTVWDVPLHFGPKQLENISIYGTINPDFGKNITYITFDPLGEDLQYIALVSAELSLSLTKGFGIFPIAACDKNQTSACINRSIKTCENKEENESVIYIRHGNQTKVDIINLEKCIIIEGDKEGIIKAVDRLLLKFYKIMK